MASQQPRIDRAAVARLVDRTYGARHRANQLPVLDEEGNFTGEYYDRRLAPPSNQPDPNRLAPHMEYFRSTGRQKLKVGAPIPGFDPIEQFESEDLFDSAGNIMKTAYLQSLTGLAGEAAGLDLVDREKMAHFEPNLFEQIAAGIGSFAMPLDLAALFLGGPVVGGGFAKSVGVAKAVGRFGVKALPGTAARVGTRILTSGGAFGTYEGARGIFEGKPVKKALKGIVFGGTMGLAGGIVPRSIKIPKIVTGEVAAARVGKAAEVSAEVFTLGALPGPLEGRAPTADDFIHAAGFILGMKMVGKIAGLGKRGWDRRLLPVKDEIREQVKNDTRDVSEAQKLRTATFAMSDRTMRETPEQFSGKQFEQIKRGKIGEQQGEVGDLFVGKQIRRSFRGELRAPIYIGDPKTIPKRELREGEVVTGWLAPDAKGRMSVWLNGELPEAYAPSIFHELFHLKALKLKRPLVTAKGKERKAAEAAAERGAEFVLRTKGQVPLREALKKRVGRPEWVRTAEKSGILLQKQVVKPKTGRPREVYHIRSVTGKTATVRVEKVRGLIDIAKQEGVPLYLTKAAAKSQLFRDLSDAGMIKEHQGAFKIVGTRRALPPAKKAPITKAEAVSGEVALDREFKAITGKLKVRVEKGEPVSLSKQQIDQAKTRIRKHYGLNRPVTTEEVIAEVKNLRRKGGDFDDLSGRLAASLQTGQHPIKITRPTPAQIKKGLPLRVVLRTEIEAVKKITSDSKIIRIIKAGWEALPKSNFLVRSRFLGKTPQFQEIVDLAFKANQKRAQRNTYFLKQLSDLTEAEGRFDKTIKGERGIKWRNDLLAGKFPKVEAVFKELWTDYNDVAAVPMGFIERYFPQGLTESIRNKMELGLLEIERMLRDVKEIGDEHLRQVEKRLQLKRKGFVFKKGEGGPEGEVVAVSAIRLLRKDGTAKSISDAIQRLGVEYLGDVFAEPRFSKKRTLKLPTSWYEMDAGKIVPHYFDVMTKSIAEKTFFGGKAEKFLKLLEEIEGVDIAERDMAKDMISRWTGHYQREHALQGGWKTLVDWFVMLQVGTKIGLGQATALNITQFFISTLPRLGIWPTVLGGTRLFDPVWRDRVRATGIADNFVAQALEAAIGNMPGGWFGKFAQFTTKWSGFSAINKFNLYWAASAFERAATQWHRQAQGTGKLAKMRRKQLERFGIDWRKKMTKEQMDEAMFAFAKDSQLQAGVLSEPLIASDPVIRPLILFKRFGFKQALLIKDIITKDVFWGDPKKGEINPMPIIRLAIGGTFGGAGIGWALNQIKGGLSGQPIIERGDSTLQRFIENMATVGAFGMVGDALAIERMSNLPRTLKFIGYPVALADAETLLKNFTLFWADMERYDDFWLAGRRNIYRVFDLAGTFPRHAAKRLRTGGQVSRAQATQKGQQKTAFFRLMLDGRREDAQARLLSWNNAHPNDKLNGYETSIGSMAKWLERRARSIAEGQAAKGTPEYRKIKREQLVQLRKRMRENR